MKKFLVVMIASCFSFGFICPTYGSWFISLFPFSSSSEDKLCIKAKKNFTSASFKFVDGLEEERLLLESGQTNSTNITQIQERNKKLEKILNISANTMSNLCSSTKSVVKKGLKRDEI
jgi:hypothetical protein